MTPEQLIDAARSVARPCVRLSATPGSGGPVAWWGAHRTRASADGFDHLLLLDLAGLNAERFGLPPVGSARLYLGQRELEGGFELDSTRASAGELREAERYWEDVRNPFTGATMGRKYSWRSLETDIVPLWPYEDESLPWTGDLFRHAPKQVLKWIHALGWNADWGCSPNFRGAEVVEAYERHYFDRLWGADRNSRLTVARDDTFVVVGGWPFPMDGQEDHEGELVLTAFACSEPQVEVWREPSGEYGVVARIT